MLLLQAPASAAALRRLACDTDQLVSALPDVSCPRHQVLNELLQVAGLTMDGLVNGYTVIAQMAEKVRLRGWEVWEVMGYAGCV
jgi:hypothetical protein